MTHINLLNKTLQEAPPQKDHSGHLRDLSTLVLGSIPWIGKQRDDDDLDSEFVSCHSALL